MPAHVAMAVERLDRPPFGDGTAAFTKMTVANRSPEFGHMVPLHIAMAAAGENQRRFVALPRRRFAVGDGGE